jgi:hypothetical protein
MGAQPGVRTCVHWENENGRRVGPTVLNPGRPKNPVRAQPMITTDYAMFRIAPMRMRREWGSGQSRLWQRGSGVRTPLSPAGRREHTR